MYNSCNSDKIKFKIKLGRGVSAENICQNGSVQLGYATFLQHNLIQYKILENENFISTKFFIHK